MVADQPGRGERNFEFDPRPETNMEEMVDTNRSIIASRSHLLSVLTTRRRSLRIPPGAGACDEVQPLEQVMAAGDELVKVGQRIFVDATCVSPRQNVFLEFEPATCSGELASSLGIADVEYTTHLLLDMPKFNHDSVRR